MRTSFVESDEAESSSLTVHDGDGGNRSRDDAGQGEIAQLRQDYERPRILVIGEVRALTAGSTSSGNKDANSQYYW